MEIKIETSHQQIDRKERGLMKSDGVDIALNPSVLDFVEDIKTLEQACLAGRNATLNETDFRSSSL